MSPRLELSREESGKNISAFLWFRVLFHCRFYYPVFAVLFLDYGLTLADFAMLNVAWAAVIIVAEVPFGSLADRIGRKPLIVLSAAIMVVEMSLILCAPLNDPASAFWFFLANRFFSGIAEALSSGADEALAYDSLKAAGAENKWPDVLKRLSGWQSTGFFIAMLAGAACYDEHFMGWLVSAAGLPFDYNKNISVPAPVFLTLGTAMGALLAACRMEEPLPHRVLHNSRDEKMPTDQSTSILVAFRTVIASHAIWSLILLGLLFDGTTRMMLTLSSEYYRVIGFPEVAFGALGAFSALTGWFTGMAGNWLVKNRRQDQNLLLLGCLGSSSLALVALMVPYAGVVFFWMMMVGFGLMNFFLSHYLNLEVDSSVRATVLSLKSMAFNIGYAWAGLLYASLGWFGGSSEHMAFENTAAYFPLYFTASYFAGLAFVRWARR